MTYKDLGYNDTLEKHRIEHKLDSFDVGRVISEHKDRYIVKTPTREFDSEILGNLRFTAQSRYDLPAVGDWVAFSEYDNSINGRDKCRLFITVQIKRSIF